MSREDIQANELESAEAHFIELYSEIRRLAHQIVNAEAADCSVEATSLMHEAFEHVIHGNAQSEQFQSPEHLLNALTAKMRLLLLDRARRKSSAKRGGNILREHLDFDRIEPSHMDPAPLLALDRALEELGEHFPESAKLVEWHIFLGMTLVETAHKMEISRSRADALWLHARHWLYRKMKDLD